MNEQLLASSSLVTETKELSKSSGKGTQLPLPYERGCVVKAAASNIAGLQSWLLFAALALTAVTSVDFRDSSQASSLFLALYCCGQLTSVCKYNSMITTIRTSNSYAFMCIHKHANTECVPENTQPKGAHFCSKISLINTMTFYFPCYLYFSMQFNLFVALCLCYMSVELRNQS